MKKVLRKNRLTAGILVLVVVCLGIVLAGDVVVKEGDLAVDGDLATTGTGTFGSIGLIGGHLVPDTDNAYDLGLGVAPPDEKYWRNLCLKGDITGANIDVTGDITGANIDVTGDITGANIDVAGNIELYGYLMDEVDSVSVEDLYEAVSHITSSGTSHTYINQDLRTTSSPTFRGVKILLDGNGSVGTLKLGLGQDAGIWYDGTHLHIDPALVGSGTVIIDNLPTSDPDVVGGLWVDANRFLKVSRGSPPPPKK